jgi:lactate dehydrogenase-like 2-hydroxyacid dehydrogenase
MQPDGRPEILLTGEMPVPAGRAFEDHFKVHKLDGSGSAPAGYKRIRGVASAGKGRVDGNLIGRLPALEIIANFGVGTERVDLAAARQRGIVVTNTPGVLTDEVADLAMGLLLATVRRIPEAQRFLRAGRWLEARFPLSPTLRGRKVGIVGFGRIGQAIARRLAGFDVEIAYHSRTPQPGSNLPFFPSVMELARHADVLILCIPGGAETANLVDSAVLEALGRDGILINVARGSVVDQPALTNALRSKTILAAGLDVFAVEPCLPEELAALDDVVLLPHVGSSSARTWADMGGLVLDNLASWFAGRGALTPV